MRKRPFYIVAAIAALGVACEDPPPKPPITNSPGGAYGGAGGGGGGATVGDGGASGDAASDGAASGDAGACTDLPITGAVVPQQVATGSPPLGTGGTLVDGIYNLTDATYYGGPGALPGPSGAEYRGSIRITGQTFERHISFKSAGGATIETTASGTLVPNGANAFITLTCPVAAQEQVTYTATGSNLVITNVITNESLGFTRTQ